MIDLLGLGPAHRFRSIGCTVLETASSGSSGGSESAAHGDNKAGIVMNGGREPAAKGPMKAVIAARDALHQDGGWIGRIVQHQFRRRREGQSRSRSAII